MSTHVNRNNWRAMLEQALERVGEEAAASARGSYEESVLCTEALLLEKMRDQVRDRAPGDREPVQSQLVAVSARESIAVPRDLIELSGAVFDVYRRWRDRLIW